MFFLSYSRLMKKIDFFLLSYVFGNSKLWRNFRFFCSYHIWLHIWDLTWESHKQIQIWIIYYDNLQNYIQLNLFITDSVITNHSFHRSHRFLYKLIGSNENLLLTNAFGRTDLFFINGFNCICIYTVMEISKVQTKFDLVSYSLVRF